LVLSQKATHKKDNAMQYICKSCGTVSNGKNTIKGLFLIELFLWCCFLLPGLIYTTWRLCTRKRVCRACGGADIIPVETPYGQTLVAHFHPRQPPILK
jgi:hypothetical protein